MKGCPRSRAVMLRIILAFHMALIYYTRDFRVYEETRVTSRCQGLFPPHPFFEGKALGTRLPGTHSQVQWQKMPFLWAGLMNCYAFPPFSLLPRVLAKIRYDKALVLLIAPVWPTQSWYPLLLQLSTVQPILLPLLDNRPPELNWTWLLRSYQENSVKQGIFN